MFWHMYKVPETEITRVNDLIGLISRKVIDRSIHPVPKYPVVSPKAAPDPMFSQAKSILARALSVYNGWIPFDAWLNHVDTTWNQCRLVARVLSGREKKALAFLRICELTSDVKTAGYLRGKIAAMEGICLLRQIYTRIHEGKYMIPMACKTDVDRFIRFVCVPADTVAIAKDMHAIALTTASLDEFEMRWFSTIVPVNNVIHARRIFKTRVKKAVLHECYSWLHQRQWETDFGMYYFLGVLSRLDTLDLQDPYWNEDTLHTLRNLFFLISQVESIDNDFTRQILFALIPVFRTKQLVQLESIYTRFVAWQLYKGALHGKSLVSVAESLSIWEKQLTISIRSNPRVLAVLYRELKYYDLAYAEREVGKVVVIVDLSRSITL